MSDERASGHAASPHGVVLTFSYPDAESARVVERSVRQEVDDIDGDRTSATLSRTGATLTVDVVAEDLVALRAGLNTWCTLVEVAERSSAASKTSSCDVSERSSGANES
ncbi:KEOPS complex subunit Pcc1 [Halomarina oriensis]|uniref:Rpo operon protein n=1 Tax=Halomarina oriensis TaxID=671145 RepID=A0A6B0GKV7_9EURY|nr:rpo operon protein [Halomarina oriensis]